ncbi:MAG: hypothetical protein K8U57_29205 [Planctomycetes bacterium]|nr:hypothetical protein [Planctomycetota bacterium]
MAYNPFNIFRRNQKAIFAVVTVFIMFTFVLSSGLGGGADFFDWLPRWLGAKGKQGDVVCTIDGTKVTEAELTDTRRGLRYRRVMANRYMSLAADMTVNRLESTVGDQLNRMSPEGRKMMEGVLYMERLLRSPEAAQFGFQMAQEIQKMHEQIRQMANSPTARPEDKEVAQAKLASTAIGVALSHAQQSGNPEQYFIQAPNRTQSELISFMLWQKKADQLGIQFTTEDVKQLVSREFFGQFAASEQRLVQKAMADRMPGFTMEACLKAVGEEFRVRTAQVAVLGDAAHNMRGDKTYGGFPAFETPYDQFESFRDQTSPTTYAVIPVPVDKFINSIPDPNLNDPAVLGELKNLFQQYKLDEPDPRKETPGFKDPRKIRVDWFSVSGTEPYYTQLAEERLKLSDPVAKTGSMLTVPMLNVGPAYLAAAVAPLAVKDVLLEAEYEREYADKHRGQVDNRWAQADHPPYYLDKPPLSLLLDTSVVRPGNLGVAAGAMGGQLLGFGNPFVAAAVMGTGPISYEVRDRIKAGMPLVLGAVPLPGAFNTLMGGEAAYRTMVPKPLPLAVYSANLKQELLARNARELANDDVQKFIKDVNKLSEDGKAKDKTAAQKFIDEFVTRRGIKIQGNEIPRTEWNLEEDAALAPLLAAQRESLRAAASAHGMQQQRGYVPFGEKFFWTNNPMTRSRTPATGTLAPMPYPNERMAFDVDPKPKPQFVVWRKAEEPAKPRLWAGTPDSSEVYKDIVRAWKRNKARELAKADAEKLANDIRVLDTTNEAVLFQRLKDAALTRGTPFVIRGVAPMTTNPDPTGDSGFDVQMLHAGSPGRLTPFQVHPSENLRYPTFEFANALLQDRTKDFKFVSVMPDAPKDTYYVVTLVKRDVKREDNYKFEVTGDFAKHTGGSQVISRYRQQSQRDAFISIMGLLKKEFKYEVTEEQKKKLEESDKRGIEG